MFLIMLYRHSSVWLSRLQLSCQIHRHVVLSAFACHGTSVRLTDVKMEKFVYRESDLIHRKKPTPGSKEPPLSQEEKDAFLRVKHSAFFNATFFSSWGCSYLEKTTTCSPKVKRSKLVGVKVPPVTSCWRVLLHNPAVSIEDEKAIPESASWDGKPPIPGLAQSFRLLCRCPNFVA